MNDFYFIGVDVSKKKLDFSELTMSEEEESKEYILDDSHSVEYMA